MKQFDPIRVLLILVLITSVPVFFHTNSASAQESPSEEPNDLQQLSANQLGIWIAPLTAEQLRSLADIEMARLRETSNKLAIAIVQQLRTHAEEDADTSEIDARVTELLAARNQITPRVNVVLEALKAKGGDVAGDIAYIKEVERLSPQITPPPAEQASATDLQEAQLAANVAAAIAAVRELPPVHERAQPWTIPLDELELEMQPLTKDQLDERAQRWLTILQNQVRERIRMDIAMTQVEADAQRQELARRSAEQQQVVRATVERVEAMLRLLQKRGGDISEYRQYIASATGQKLNLTDPAVLYAQAIAWLRSSDGGVKIALNVLKFIGLLLLFWLASRFLGAIMNSAVDRIPKASSLLKKFLVGGVRRATLLIGLVIAISALGVNITPLLAAIGAAGLVLGLALQGTLSNFASGILILIYRPYDIGDFISAGGVSGKVESMNLVSTSILTVDNQALIVPNNAIWNNVITNVTGRKTRRVDLTFGIGYADDISEAVSVIEEAIKKHPKVLADPAPVVRMHELADSSVNLIARPWTRTEDYWDVYWDLTRQVKERFDTAGINIPFPQRDLHLSAPIEVRIANGGHSSRQDRERPAFESRPEGRSMAAVVDPAPAGDDGEDA